MKDVWSAEAQRLPSGDIQVEKMRGEIKRLTAQVRKRAVKEERMTSTKDVADWAAEDWVDGLVAEFDDTARRARWAMWESQRREAVKEEELSQLEDSVKGFVCAHVDKNPGEGLIM
jgi:hypothetical protein